MSSAASPGLVPAPHLRLANIIPALSYEARSPPGHSRVALAAKTIAAKLAAASARGAPAVALN